MIVVQQITYANAEVRDQLRQVLAKFGDVLPPSGLDDAALRRARNGQ